VSGGHVRRRRRLVELCSADGDVNIDSYVYIDANSDSDVDDDAELEPWAACVRCWLLEDA
jgi:hypothetical protein